MTDQKFELYKSDIDAIRDLADVMDEKNLTEVEFERGETCLRLSRQNFAAAAAPMPANTPQSAATVPQNAGDVPAANAAKTLDAPMVGTFYAAPSPDAQPFVKIGDSVQKGQTIGIIEAMKTMNQIEADKAGTITEILAEDGQPVAFSQPLFSIS